MRACVRACVCARARACVCVRVCVCAPFSLDILQAGRVKGLKLKDPKLIRDSNVIHGGKIIRKKKVGTVHTSPSTAFIGLLYIHIQQRKMKLYVNAVSVCRPENSAIQKLSIIILFFFFLFFLQLFFFFFRFKFMSSSGGIYAQPCSFALCR